MLKGFVEECQSILKAIDWSIVEDMVLELHGLKGRLFVLGVGGNASTASHFVADLRKMCDIEAYTPTDNIAEITARTNDEGWDSVFIEWLKTSKLSHEDIVFILSVGGGDIERKGSINLVRAMDFAFYQKALILGIIGRRGYAAKVADRCLIIPKLNPERITIHTEWVQSLVCHYIVSQLQVKKPKWEEVLEKSG